jgi:hypothetical protein
LVPHPPPPTGGGGGGGGLVRDVLPFSHPKQRDGGGGGSYERNVRQAPNNACLRCVLVRDTCCASAFFLRAHLRDDVSWHSVFLDNGKKYSGFASREDTTA